MDTLVRHFDFLENSLDNLVLKEIDSCILITDTQDIELFIKKIIPLLFGDKKKLRELDYEQAYCVVFDNDLTCKGYINIGNGTKTKMTVDLNRMWCFILSTQSKYFLVLHNHPNNSIYPSKADLKFNSIVIMMSQFLGLYFLQHIIITKDAYMLTLNNNGGEQYEW